MDNKQQKQTKTWKIRACFKWLAKEGEFAVGQIY